ncbi:MAG: adenylyltransferase/cytidyltransferase family protein [Candidatus Aenigmarchaeota archaeon]|nr:adenylyltransferase/cytidyltransferase family protein [Candidatus Aenigmarchaeota archaeon]NIQ17275.1 adenylyltransferase/cytidyltransferase family protein [Candidatus Aenigmarchaeota archaeon]NIS73136.1 adenylyltransferase/cytidyltransferase family protein [Candidatus Aenigmarchaeota archaeon]
MVNKVLIGGVFNLVHKGHEFFLKRAKELGDYLIVVIASNRTAQLTKKYPVLDQVIRKKNLEKLGIADRVVIGDEADFMNVVRREKPNVIVLGYDQKISEKELEKMLKKEGIDCEIIRIRDELKGYKTSNIIKNKEED